MFMNYASVCNPYSGFSAPVNGTSATECAEKALFSGLSRHVLHYGLGIKDGRKIDPAVGSGHFLVSALNQLIYIKSRLGIIFVNGTNELLRDCDIYVQDDVLMVTDAQGNPFQYHKESKASQRIQETLFNEKRNIIEHCLFGVDMNDKAVQICRLRLWIELLKNAYYKNNVMETLPNIDINIKTGNSLFSKMPCTPGQKIFKSNVTAEMKRRLQEYKHDVDAYRHESSKDRKKTFAEGSVLSKNWFIHIRNSFPCLSSTKQKIKFIVIHLTGESNFRIF